ncbi:MAG: hypothetical protein NWE85_06980 [Candidatus Bathyarchaeota archaeon]|nr:hypothetical protein [Candidatus Bathyarchaeota archaeon]
MNKKMLVLSAVILSTILCVPLVIAAYEPYEVTVWTDKQKYVAGEKGTLYIAFYNNRDVAATIQNITITYYSWKAYTGEKWVGNETRTVNIPLSAKDTYVFDDITFTVPTDGRAVPTTVYVEIGTDHEPESGNGYINVPEVPRYMEQIVTLLTILVVLLIVCTIIIAATIFLSARRPQVTWKPTEKTE